MVNVTSKQFADLVDSASVESDTRVAWKYACTRESVVGAGGGGGSHRMVVVVMVMPVEKGRGGVVVVVWWWWG